MMLVFVSLDKAEVGSGLSLDVELDRSEECNYHIKPVIYTRT